MVIAGGVVFTGCQGSVARQHNIVMSVWGTNSYYSVNNNDNIHW